MANDYWIADATKNKGALRKKLKVKKGENIPASKLEKASKSKNTKLAREANLAITLKGLKKKK